MSADIFPLQLQLSYDLPTTLFVLGQKQNFDDPQMALPEYLVSNSLGLAHLYPTGPNFCSCG